MKPTTMTLRERAAKLERQFLTRSPQAQEALIDLIKSMFLVFGPGGLLPMEDVTAVLDLVQNVGGKLERGMGSQLSMMNELQAGAPNLTGRVLAALASPPA